MAIEWEYPRTAVPLKQTQPPVVSVEKLVAIAQVRLTAGDVPPRILRQFYEGVLGLKFLEADAAGLLFAYQRRRVLLARGGGEVGHVGLQVKDFPEVLLRLRDRNIGYEILHSDGGMTRMAYVRDPAGNWVQLIETRAF